MLKKAVVIVMDGLGDRPVAELGDMTPLEAAQTPNLDALAHEGECGMMCALGRGQRPGSDTSHLAIFGYDPAKYYSGRGPIEVAGLGVQLLHGDVALRANFGTVSPDGVIRDRRAGRILDVSALAAAVDGLEIDGVQFIVRPGTAHRAGVVMRGDGLSGRISDADPHEPGVPLGRARALDETPEAERTARVLNAFLERAHDLLAKHPINTEREARGELPANYLLVRGAGQYLHIPAFSERYGMTAACVAGGGLYKGIGRLLGMDIEHVPGATGLGDTDIQAKFEAAHRLLSSHDFVYVHIKAADSYGEDGDWRGKRDFIERIDVAAKALLDWPDDTLVVMTADHTTPCQLMQHSADAVPLVFRGAGLRTDSVSSFGERSCTAGGLGLFNGLDVMPHVLNCLGRLHLVGA